MSAEILRRAASLMRERAEAALGDRPEWATDVDAHGERSVWAYRDEFDYAPRPVLAEFDLRKTPGAFDHFASWHPAVALAVADWLDAYADRLDTLGHGIGSNMGHAIAVARAYLGGDA